MEIVTVWKVCIKIRKRCDTIISELPRFLAIVYYVYNMVLYTEWNAIYSINHQDDSATLNIIGAIALHTSVRMTSLSNGNDKCCCVLNGSLND